MLKISDIIDSSDMSSMISNSKKKYSFKKESNKKL